MNLLILRTDIENSHNLKFVKPIFDKHVAINSWSIDQEDVDKVLRIEANQDLKNEDVIGLMNSFGFYCEPLEDCEH